MFLLLFFGAGVNAHAIASDAEVSKTWEKNNSSKSSSDSSSEETPEHLPVDVITNLDFFGAFSLVNVQLHWKDLYQDDSAEESYLVEDNLLELELSEVTSNTDLGDDFVAATVVETIDVVASPVFFSEKETTGAVIHGRTRFAANTISFIQNNGTYPLFS